VRPRLAVAALALLVAAGCGGGTTTSAQTTTLGLRADGSGKSALTLPQAIGQHFVFAYSGLQPPTALQHRIARGEAAGVILFARNVRSVAQVKATIAKLQAIKRPAAVDAPLLIMVDQEGGTVRRIPGGPAAGASATPSAAAARTNGTATARALRAADVNVDLAPVVDVARPGSEREREGRTYGRDAATVVQRAGAFATALQSGGVAPVLKHFPGFGAATINTDDGTARVDLPLSTLRRVDLAPYAQLKPRAVMLSTAIYPRVDPRPAAFSHRWATDELRGRLGFGGVAMTDDLQAAAVAKFGTPAQLAFFALQAGVDLPLFAQTYTAGAQAAAGLAKAVHSGALPRTALDESTERVLAWRTALAGG
jgi:beta-N-acetylhexosaminidase